MTVPALRTGETNWRFQEVFMGVFKKSSRFARISGGARMPCAIQYSFCYFGYTVLYAKNITKESVLIVTQTMSKVFLIDDGVIHFFPLHIPLLEEQEKA
jgi:hypothetical protein